MPTTGQKRTAEEIEAGAGTRAGEQGGSPSEGVDMDKRARS